MQGFRGGPICVLERMVDKTRPTDAVPITRIVLCSWRAQQDCEGSYSGRIG